MLLQGLFRLNFPAMYPVLLSILPDFSVGKNLALPKESSVPLCSRGNPVKNSSFFPKQTAPKLYSTLFIHTFLCILTRTSPSPSNPALPCLPSWTGLALPSRPAPPGQHQPAQPGQPLAPANKFFRSTGFLRTYFCFSTYQIFPSL